MWIRGSLVAALALTAFASPVRKPFKFSESGEYSCKNKPLTSWIAENGLETGSCRLARKNKSVYCKVRCDAQHTPNYVHGGDWLQAKCTKKKGWHIKKLAKVFDRYEHNDVLCSPCPTGPTEVEPDSASAPNAVVLTQGHPLFPGRGTFHFNGFLCSQLDEDFFELTASALDGVSFFVGADDEDGQHECFKLEIFTTDGRCGTMEDPECNALFATPYNHCRGDATVTYKMKVTRQALPQCTDVNGYHIFIREAGDAC